jgi:hypothetical protein
MHGAASPIRTRRMGRARTILCRETTNGEQNDTDRFYTVIHFHFDNKTRNIVSTGTNF